MTAELDKSVGIREDPQQATFHNKVQEWARGEISYEQMVEYYPTYLLSVPERFVKFVQRKALQITGSGAKR